MSKRLVQIDKAIIPPVTPEPIERDMEAFLELSDAIEDSFRGYGLVEAGTSLVGKGERLIVRDPSWGGDIAEFIIRSKPHDQTTKAGTRTVSLKLETLQAEVDDFGEICAWIYDES